MKMYTAVVVEKHIFVEVSLTKEELEFIPIRPLNISLCRGILNMFVNDMKEHFCHHPAPDWYCTRTLYENYSIVLGYVISHCPLLNS